MADAAELKKIQETLDYFNRYYEFDSAIKVLKENRQYLETYIRTKHYVEDKYDAYGKTRKSMLIALIVAAVAALVVLIATGFKFEAAHIVIAAVVAAVCWCGVFFVMKAIITKNVNQKWAEQQKVNDDIAVQIEEVTKRCENLEGQRNGYLSALDEKGLIVIPSKYIIEAQKIASYVKDGKAETAQQAVQMFEDEQNKLKERALAERKRREEEAAAAKALNIERERQRAIREQREAELRKVAEEERQRANVTPVSEKPEEKSSGLSLGGKTFSAREQQDQSADIAEEAQAPKSSGLNLALSGKKNSKKSEAPQLDEQRAPAPESRPQSSGLSLAGSKGRASGAAARPQEHRTVESVMHGGEMSGFAGSGLSLASSKKKKPQRQSFDLSEEKPSKKHEPIRLVDEPDTPEVVDEETLDLEARMKSLLSDNKPVLKRHTPITQEEEESIEERIEHINDGQPVEPEIVAQPEPAAEEPAQPEIAVQPETVAEEPAEQPIPEAEAEPEIQPEPISEPEPVPEAQSEPEPIPEPEHEPEPQPEPVEEEKPKSPFSGLAMKKK